MAASHYVMVVLMPSCVGQGDMDNVWILACIALGLMHSTPNPS